MVNDVVTLISTVGFPIAAAVGCFWYMTKLNDMHREETESLREAVENNTKAIIRLLDKLGGDIDK